MNDDPYRAPGVQVDHKSWWRRLSRVQMVTLGLVFDAVLNLWLGYRYESVAGLVIGVILITVAVFLPLVMKRLAK